MSEQENTPTFPSNQTFFADAALYANYPVPDKARLFELLYTTNAVDLYCTECDDDSVFRPIDNRPKVWRGGATTQITSAQNWMEDPTKMNSVLCKEFHCSRVDSHQMSFFIQVRKGVLSKVGQSVSLADLAEQGIRGYKEVLGDSYREFSTAIGLASHGVGVGAYVYLRRIIENLVIKPAYDIAKLNAGWDDQGYQKSRFREKVDMLRDQLPDFLVQNKALYSLLIESAENC